MIDQRFLLIVKTVLTSAPARYRWFILAIVFVVFGFADVQVPDFTALLDALQV